MDAHTGFVCDRMLRYAAMTGTTRESPACPGNLKSFEARDFARDGVLFALARRLARRLLLSPDEAALERNFDALIHPDDLRDWMKLLAAEPNHVSSPHDKSNADQILAWFKQWGWDAHIETFWVLYPTPVSETLELVGSAKVHRHAAGAADSRRLQRDRDRSRAARLCRLPERRRCHCRTGLRQLRNAGRLQDAPAPGRQRQRQDCHRALRRRLARVEAQAGVRSRRDRMHHLLRPCPGRLFDRRDLS